MNLILNPRLQNRMKLVTMVLGFIAFLLACGGGAGGGVDTARYTVGGTLNGLAAGQSVSVKESNSGQQVTLNANGNYTAAVNLPSDATYSLSISAQPAGQLCTLNNSSGKVGGNGVSNVAVNCANTLNFLAGDIGGTRNVDGPGTNASFNAPSGITIDAAGNVFVTDIVNHNIRKINPNGDVSTIAGDSGIAAHADGVGSSSRFNAPRGIAADSVGNLYVADTGNHTIRKISQQGTVTVIAGRPSESGSADGTGSVARFNAPQGIAIDGAGNLYVADTNNHVIRKVSPAGMVSTFAGAAGQSGYVDGVGVLARLGSPTGIAIDSTGNVLVLSTHLVERVIVPFSGICRYCGTYAQISVVRKISPQALVTTGLVLSRQDANVGTSVNLSTIPSGFTVDHENNYYFTSPNSYPNSVTQLVSKITSLGDTIYVAGSIPGIADGTATMARFSSPQGVAVDRTGMLYVADTGNSRIRKIDPQGMVSTFAGKEGKFGRTDGYGAVARFNQPQGLTTDGAGNVYLADTWNDTIRKIDPQGRVSTFAGGGSEFGITDGPARLAQFSKPRGIAIDSVGNIFVAGGGQPNIRKITPSGDVSTFAGRSNAVGAELETDGVGTQAGFNFPHGLAIDHTDHVYVVDTRSHTIRKISPQGVVTTIAGIVQQSGSADGIGKLAQFNLPQGIAVDRMGVIYVADTLNHTIRKISPQGVVSTFAGSPGKTGNVDGTGTLARFNTPIDLAINDSGSLYVADTNNGMIRKISPQGYVSTVVGQAGFPGISLSKLPANLGYVPSISLQSGKLFIISEQSVLWTYAP